MKRPGVGSGQGDRHGSVLTQLAVVAGVPVGADTPVGLELVHTGAAVPARVTAALVHLWKETRAFVRVEVMQWYICVHKYQEHQ